MYNIKNIFFFQKVTNSDGKDEDEMEESVEKLLNEAKESFNGEIYVAYDLWSYKII